MIRFQPTPVLPTPLSSSRNIDEQIADVIREHCGAGEAVTIERLQQLGYSEAVSRRHAPSARGIARRLFVRRLEA